MAVYEIENMSFTYAGSEKPAIEMINMTIQEGEFLLIGGPTGSGKTTLLRMLKQQTQPAGKKAGSIRYLGQDIDAIGEKRSAEDIGMVFQDPENQIVMQTVWQEMTFGMENLGYTAGLIQKRLAEIIPFFSMASWVHQEVRTLSGGQKQLLNLASVMMLRPKVLLLDEPTSQLDPIATNEFIDMLMRINREYSITVILSEHRLEHLYARANRLLLMSGGQVAALGTPGEVLESLWKERPSLSPYVPTIGQMFFMLEGSREDGCPVPLSVREARWWFDGFYGAHRASFKEGSRVIETEGSETPRPLLEARSLAFRYDRASELVLDQLSLQVLPGELFALMGGNGSGKSTLLKVLAGIYEKQRGKIKCRGRNIDRRRGSDTDFARIGYVGQEMMAYFTKETVKEQLEERAAWGGEAAREQMQALIEYFDLQSILLRHPHDISGGQQQKVVLTMVLMDEPEILLLDEPTKGLDPVARVQFAGWINGLRKKGTGILMVTHDLEFAAAHASKCGLLFNGCIATVERPDVFFSENFYYTTMIRRTVREHLSGVFSLEGVLEKWVRSDIR